MERNGLLLVDEIVHAAEAVLRASEVSLLLSFGRRGDSFQHRIRTPSRKVDGYVDRDESWLRFNQRVLELAEDVTVALLERVRFLAIFASNLDEFFMVRVAGRVRRMAARLPVQGASGIPPPELLASTLAMAGELAGRHAACFTESVQPALEAGGIQILRWKQLAAGEKQRLQQLFRDRIYPVLAPLAVDPAHPFPYICSLSLISPRSGPSGGLFSAALSASTKGPNRSPGQDC
jgi:polyphosphate kinase